MKMKKGLLIIFVLSLLFSSCGLFYKSVNENGKRYYIDKKGQEFYLAPINQSTKFPSKKSKS
jgi:hypothetical protein